MMKSSVSNNYTELIEKTYGLSKRLADYSVLERIKLADNKGKRIQMGVSATLILDTFDAYGEFREKICNLDKGESKVSLSLLARYIFESYINFLYVFNAKKGNMQIRAKAFFYYGGYKKESMRSAEETTREKEEWNKYVHQKGRRTSWHGKTFKDLCKEANYGPVVYQVLSQFTQPGIFTMERIKNTEMFKEILGDSSFFISASVCDLIEISNKKRLCGLKLLSDNEVEIKKLVAMHHKTLNEMKARGQEL